MLTRLVRTGLAVAIICAVVLSACVPTSSSPTSAPAPTSAPPSDAIPTAIIQRTPERGEEMATDGTIELVFDRAMERKSVEAAFRLRPAVGGSFEWPDERTVRFVPKQELKRDTSFQVTLDASAMSVDGSSLAADYGFRFETVGYLEVAQVIPAPDTADVEAASTITAVFNRPVVPLQAISDPDSANLPQPVAFTPPIEGSGEWLNTSIYVFTPSADLAGGTNYTAQVTAGLADTTGGVLDKDFVWSFSTQPPQVVWILPHDQQELVDINTSIQVTFNVPVDPDSAASAFHLRGNRTEVAGEISVVETTLTFTPSAPLAFNTRYTAWVDSGVPSAAGGRGMREDYPWEFTTVPLPRIIGTNPADGDRSASPYTAFEIKFNTPINADTVMPSLTMEPPLSPTQVYTYFNTWDNIFIIEFGSQPSTDYTVHISPNIADPYGNTTGQDITVRYRTAPLAPSAYLNLPGMIGTMDAHQPSQMLASYLNTTRLDLRLHPLDQAEFLKAQRDWWDFDPTAPPMRDWSIPVEAIQNEMLHKQINLADVSSSLEPGIYMLELRAPEVDFDRWSQRRLLVVSEYNVTIKNSRDEVWVWVTNLQTGEPTAGLTLTLWDYEGASAGERTTDTDGLARFALTSGTRHDSYTVVSQQPFVLGSSGWDWSTGISPWDFGLEQEQQYGDFRFHVYTDRPIYRPDQIVHFRGVVRAEDDARYNLPDGASVSVEVYDAVGEQIFASDLDLDDFGAFHGDFDVVAGASLGQYSIQATFADESAYESFRVAAYRPPEFQMTVSPDTSELAAGDVTKATLDLAYFFGGPVADVTIDWNVLSTPYRFEPAQFQRYAFTDSDDLWLCRWCWWPQPDQTGTIVANGSGTTDSDGGLSIALPTQIMTGRHRLTIEGTAYGRDGQAISGRADVVVHPASFYVGLAPQQYVTDAGDETAVDIVTVGWGGQRVPDIPLEIQVFHREWANIFVENELGGGSWKWETTDTLVFTGTLNTDSNAEGIATFTPEQGGSYRVIVSGRDRKERLIRSSTWLWVSDTDYVSWRRENNDRITLVSDKSSYVPGETAEILIPTPFAGPHWAWITIERGSVLQHEVVALTTNSTVYRLPIRAEHAPNIYVSVVIVKGPDTNEPVATHKVGYIELSVEPATQLLQIELTPSVNQALPGETVSFDVVTRDAHGEPVQAGLSLDLVDKSVLSLSPRQPNAILEAFYGRRGLGISTASGLAVSINRLLQEQIEELDGLDMEAENGIGGGAAFDEQAVEAAPALEASKATVAEEADMAPSARETGTIPPGLEIREDFADTAYWNATITTDRTGHASVDVQLPDNLTTWELRGVGITAQTQLGEATTDLLVTKPLLVRPVTPRFFVVDDRVKLAALISNNTGVRQDVEVTLSATGLTLEDPAKQTIAIPQGREGRITWWASVEDTPSVDLAISAVAGDYSDAARPRLTTGPNGTLMVYRYTAPEIVGTGGQLVGDESRTEVIALPPRYDDRRGELSVRLDPSLAAGMQESLDYLEHFPYECTEQTVSRFLPNVLTYRALHELGISNADLEAKLPRLVEEGVTKLALEQHGDGGWGWWYDGESNPYLTAYVVFALVKARDADFAVPGAVIEQGLNYLSGTLVGARDLRSYREANQQAFTLYVLAEADQARLTTTYLDDLYRRRDRLSHYGRAYLAMALHLQATGIEARDSRINTLLSDVQNAAILSATGAHWEEDNYDWWAMNTDTRSTAIILDALTLIDPDGGLLPQVVRWLMIARRDGIWETTQETAWALIALTDWMSVTGELQGQYEYGVQLNGDLLTSGSVTPENIDESVSIKSAITVLLADASNELVFARGAGSGRLYYTAHLEIYLPAEEVEPLNRGIIVTRQYHEPTCTSGPACPQVNQADVGDVIQVHLTIVAPHDLYYVVIEDPLPAGTEAIDTALDTSSIAIEEPGLYRSADDGGWSSQYYWWWRWYSRSEMRDEKVVLFADYLPAGTYEYTYSFRATQAGVYQVIPTSAHEFYFPEVFGRGAGRIFTVSD